MKRLIILSSFFYIALFPTTAQTIDLFNRAEKDITAKKEFISFYEKDAADSFTQENHPTYKYNFYNTASPNGINQYQISTGGFTPTSKFQGYGYDFFEISYNGKRIIQEWGYNPLWDVRLLTMNEDDRKHYIKVPLDDNSFALLFAGLVFDGDDAAGEMIVVVVNKDKATVVFDRPACAYSFTPAPNFAIEFTEKVSYTTIVLEGLEMPGDIIPAPNATKHKIWKEGNMLKYKSWN